MHPPQNALSGTGDGVGEEGGHGGRRRPEPEDARPGAATGLAGRHCRHR